MSLLTPSDIQHSAATQIWGCYRLVSEPKVFWGADEEISDGGSPRVIIYGYDGLPIQPVVPPSPNFIPGPEDPQTPPVPQDGDEREPMFIQAHDLDYMPEPIYPEYIPLEDEHVFPAKEQPLPPVDSPTAESPGYITKSDPKEDPEEYEDDETEDGPVDYPIVGGDDGDDDDGNSSGDDINDEDEDDEDEEEDEEHLAPADSVVIVPTDEPASISLPPGAEVERLLAMTTPSPSPPISLSAPSAGEHLARCTTPPAHSPPPPVSSPLLPSPGFTAALPLPPLPPLPPSLYIPPLVDHMRSGRVLLPKTTGDQGVDYGFVSTVDVEARRQGISEVRVTELAELHEHDTQDLYALLEDAQDSTSDTAIAAGHQAQMVETLRVMKDMRQEMGDMQTELLALREQRRRARQPAPDARIPDHQDASRDADSHVKFATCTLLEAALTWWNGQIRTLGPEAYAMTWEVLKKKMTDKYCPQGEIKKLEIEPWNLKVKGNDFPAYTERFQELTLICTKFVANETKKVDKYINGLPDNIYGNVKSARPKTLDETIELANNLMDQKLRTYTERQSDNKRKADDSSRNNHGHQQ
ncbi:putative reverse transcriptase domain-containing protein [Tanacetum coccineum]|uniref:Reverse transcriptase domain-containing protein n=1 Tax=Tanacetum coccineum TaxID=301880 RepID=A0ABQ4Y5G8_9ASTR